MVGPCMLRHTAGPQPTSICTWHIWHVIEVLACMLRQAAGVHACLWYGLGLQAVYAQGLGRNNDKPLQFLSCAAQT